jgi:hypothetical protein
MLVQGGLEFAAALEVVAASTVLLLIPQYRQDMINSAMT